MDVERSLLAKVVRTQTIERAVSRGIETQHFVGKKIGGEPAAPGELWDWLTGHYRRYRAVPSMDLFASIWPTFPLPEVPDTLDAIIDQFIRVVKRRKLIDGIRTLSSVADNWDQVGDAEVYMLEQARELARLVPTTTVTRFSDSLNRLDMYKQKVALGRVPGKSFGFEELDDLTYGIQPDETAIIEGFLGIGKSTMAIKAVGDAYFLRGETPLFLSLEMDGQRLSNKWDAWAAKISYNAIKRMELGEGDISKWEQIAEAAANAKFEKDVLVLDDIHRPTIDRVFAEIERWQPSMTIVDTIDEIRAPTQYKTIWEQQGWVARELKGISRTTKRPIIGLAQAGRAAEQEGATLGNMAGSIDIARKADLVVGLHATRDMKSMKKMEVRMLKNRDGVGDGTSFDYFWNVAKMDFRRWRPEDSMPVREGAAA